MDTPTQNFNNGQPLSSDQIQSLRNSLGVDPNQGTLATSPTAPNQWDTFDKLTGKSASAPISASTEQTGPTFADKQKEMSDVLERGLSGKQSVPETAFQSLGVGAGVANDIVGTILNHAGFGKLIQLAGNVADFVTKAPAQALGSKLHDIMSPEQKSSLLDFVKQADSVISEIKQDPRIMANLKAGGNIVQALQTAEGVRAGTKLGGEVAIRGTGVLGTGVDIAKEGATNLYNLITGKPTSENLDQFISTQFEKGVRPSVSGKNTASQAEQYTNNAIGAVKTIVDNKTNLRLVDEFGEPTGKLPTSLKEFSQAIDQTKEQIFKQYDALAKETGRAGITVELKPIADELRKVSADPVMADTHPDISKYAEMRAKLLDARGEYTPEQMQQAIQLYNKSLEAFYKNPSYETASRASVDALIANKMRSALDDTINKGTIMLDSQGNEIPNTNPKYQALKNQYAQLKSIEKDVVHRAIVDGRKNSKGLLDFADIGSAAELARGLITMNPADFAGSAAIKGVSAYYKYLNNPNTVIKKLFEGVESVKQPANPENGVNLPQNKGSSESNNPTSNQMSNTTPVDTHTQHIASNENKVNSPPKGEGAIPKTSFPKNLNLSQADLKVQDAATNKYLTQKDSLVKEYLAQKGKVINTDEARKLFADVGYNGTNSPAVQESASALAKDAWRTQLANSTEPTAVLYAGGSGSGKSSAIKNILPQTIDQSGAILDGNLSSISSAKARIAEAVKSGKTPEIVYVYRDPLESFSEGVVKRQLKNAEEGGRIVPTKEIAKNHIGSYQTTKALVQEGKVKIHLVNNALGSPQSARLMTPSEFNNIKYPTVEKLTEKLNKVAKRLYDNGTITKEKYDAYIQ